MADDDEVSGGPRPTQEVGTSPTEPVIVAVGASAGGIQALQALFGSLPHNTGATFVVVVHLDPERRSDLPGILAARTSMPVTQVRGNTKLEANHVYVIPPDRRLQLIDHEISAEKFDEPTCRTVPSETSSSSARSVSEIGVTPSGRWYW